MIGVAVVAIIAVLSTLGLNVGPLLAGLGVVGIAVGFGAQTLVRDVISGIFFLMEDAFRVGEYIDTGRLRGTVEGMSLRSVRLRHQNGQIHTIPFGQVQSVTNFSRDWSVIKFNLHLEPPVDIEAVRRTVKRVARNCSRIREIGGDFIQPLKMQGVVDVLQSQLVVRCKFTATPNRPTYLPASGAAPADRGVCRRRDPLCYPERHDAALSRRINREIGAKSRSFDRARKSTLT